ncbi:PSME3-interacting protein [Procambarus clarkii]|uniref:PSME3-interacting protein n=1 Tax=Procambarus clarkii TaxID=6728 RepID=UPI001E67188B|nr:PSME3-interacting protein-like [Procambarus clarkii]
MSSGFISEKDVEERRRIRQENWEKTREENDPEEAPEEPPPDPRPLFERLQEQRQKKQEEYDEAHKFKNMVRGLEDDEVDFLELVDRSKLQEEIRVRTEENTAMAEYRKKVSAMQKNIAEEEIRAELKVSELRKNPGGSKKTSHVTLLAGAIKRKTSDDDKNTEEAGESKKAKSELSSQGNTVAVHPVTGKSGFQCIAVLPGLGVYTDSSDSDNNIDSDSDEDDEVQIPRQPRDITGRIVKPATQCTGQSGC